MRGRVSRFISHSEDIFNAHFNNRGMHMQWAFSKFLHAVEHDEKVCGWILSSE